MAAGGEEMLETMVLLLFVFGSALFLYASSKRCVMVYGVPIYVPAGNIFGGVVLMAIHFVVDGIFGVAISQTIQGALLREFSLIPPLAYGAMIGGIAKWARDKGTGAS